MSIPYAASSCCQQVVNVVSGFVFRAWHMYAEPIDNEDSTSCRITAKKSALRAIRKVMRASGYSAHVGCNTGGANAVYWVNIVGRRSSRLSIVSNITEGAKRKVPKVQAAVEIDLLYPLLRGRDVRRWSASPSAHIHLTREPNSREKAHSKKENGV